MIKITPTISLKKSEVTIRYIRAPGPGGQNVNKLATAAQLRFNVKHTHSLPETVRSRLLTLAGSKITSRGDLVIKASRYRTQERNKQDALERLRRLIIRAATPPKKRQKTKPTTASIERRLRQKKLRGKTKLLRQRKPTAQE